MTGWALPGKKVSTDLNHHKGWALGLGLVGEGVMAVLWTSLGTHCRKASDETPRTQDYVNNTPMEVLAPQILLVYPHSPEEAEAMDLVDVVTAEEVPHPRVDLEDQLRQE